MTRLMADQIRAIPAQMQSYDQELICKTGCSLSRLAAMAAGIDLEQRHPEKCRVAVIPVTAGLGTIESFSEAVCAIAVHLGFQAFITKTADAGGLAEAFRNGADMIIMADDHIYAAFNLASRRVAGNAEATARGYTAALNQMAGGLKGREVLLIGAGQVGQKAAAVLLETEARLIIYDLDKKTETMVAGAMSKKFSVPVESGLTLDQALDRFPIIFDASPGREFIDRKQVNEKTLAAAPGIPLGFTSASLDLIGPRLIHDPLQIGTAVMLYQSLA